MKAYNLNQLQDHNTKIWLKLIHTPIQSEGFERDLKRYRNSEKIIQDQLKHKSKYNWPGRCSKWISGLKNKLFTFTRVDNSIKGQEK